MREDDFSRLELNYKNCLSNYKYFRSKLLPTTKMLVLVKANAYGHGAVEFASMLQRCGVDYLAVAYPIEGIELRQAGISLPIIVLTAGTDFFEECVEYKLEPSIPNLYSLNKFVNILHNKGIDNYPIHIKLDTGMHRLGFMTNEIPQLLHLLLNCKQIVVKSIFSHLAVAEDNREDNFTIGQINMFTNNATTITNALGYKPLYHILNSAGIERFSQYQYDMVRLGIGIYGVSSVGGINLKPVASLKCKILQIKTLKEVEDTIGYGRYGHVAKEGTVIATIPVGYADGIDRRLGQGNISFMLNGHKVPTIGNICMDMCMLDITNVKAQVGDVVTIFGEAPRVEYIAKVLETIPYEVLTRVPRRIKRVIVNA